jgi:predicted CopG family antitoxin
MKKYKTVNLNEDTYEELIKLKEEGQTINGVIKRLITIYNLEK